MVLAISVSASQSVNECLLLPLMGVCVCAVYKYNTHGQSLLAGLARGVGAKPR